MKCQNLFLHSTTFDLKMLIYYAVSYEKDNQLWNFMQILFVQRRWTELLGAFPNWRSPAWKLWFVMTRPRLEIQNFNFRRSCASARSWTTLLQLQSSAFELLMTFLNDARSWCRHLGAPKAARWSRNSAICVRMQTQVSNNYVFKVFLFSQNCYFTQNLVFTLSAFHA